MARGGRSGLAPPLLLHPLMSIDHRTGFRLITVLALAIGCCEGAKRPFGFVFHFELSLVNLR